MNHSEEIPKGYKAIGTFVVKDSLYKKYKEHYLQIDALVESNKPVPAKLIIQWLTLMQDVRWVQAKLTRREIKQSKAIVDKVMDRFANDKTYQFSGSVLRTRIGFSAITMTREEKKQYEEFSFKQMIESALHQYLTIGQIDAMDKNDTVVFFLHCIKDYIEAHFTEEEFLEYKEYRWGAVAAYLTMCVGNQLWETDTVIPILNEKGKYENKSIHTHFRNKDLQKVAANAQRARTKKRKA